MHGRRPGRAPRRRPAVRGDRVRQRAVRRGGRQDRRPLRGGDLEALAVNIATALGAIHGAGIVHRDLKPSNVLLSPTGPRVIDFGIARALDATEGPTRTGQFVGTPAYIAPELMHERKITPAADVFSWGCVVAYAGTGRAPFGGGTLPEVISRVTSGDPDLDGLDPAVRDLVARSLAKDPADRPTVNQLLQALTGRDEPPATPPASEPEPAPAPAPALLTSVDSVPPTRPVGAEVPAAAARRPSPHRNRGLLIVATGAVLAVSAVIGALNIPGGEDAPDASGPGSASVLGDEPPEVKDKIFDDRFNDVDSGWKTAATPVFDAAYRDRKYEIHVLPKAARTTVDAPAGRIPDSQLIEAEVTPKDAFGEAGVYCHGGFGYAFLLSSDGRARIAKLSTWQAQTVTTGTVPKPRGTDRLQVACVKREDGNIDLAMWVNGKPVASSAATPPSSVPGNSGLLVVRNAGATGWPQAVFDDFALCGV
ncbi:protein kinase [Actinomadura luteofluorescens]|uniref:protein kinase domain-containing protein n=1 Tax=Actinomadura luteofluorescens TaxID=46163 RepID=UPI003629C141